jgi:molybdopterin-containing oxidoreductase family membrane subunit
MATVTTRIAIPDQTPDYTIERPPMVIGDNDLATVTHKICRVTEQKPPIAWWIAFLIAFATMGMFFTIIGFMVLSGIGVLGNNQPVAWGFPIVNFVFWVGIGHAGTLISAILYLFRQKWRTSINRFAEAMTIFAVICALIWPGIHTGRQWLSAYWLFPYPNQMAMWPQFRSPLLWDVFAVGTYFTVSLLFWYMGLIPDIATLRDRSVTPLRKLIYGIFALGWNGSNRHWHRYEKAYQILAALATPLVLSVHSVVSFDFAVSQLPGWHTTIFPPYFVAGAVFGGFAMVILLVIPCRVWFGMSEMITDRHMENMAKVMLATGMIVGLAYTTEFFIAWYSGNPYEGFTFINRALGPIGWGWFTMMTCNVLIPQLLWVKRLRTHMPTLFFVATAVTIGMWFERFEIIITSLTRDYLPSSWGSYGPTAVDILMFAGSFGLFFTLFILFIRFLPMINIAEVKAVMPQAHAHGEHDIKHHDHGTEVRI